MKPVMNNTKWEELRLAMYGVDPAPRFRTRTVETGHVSSWDSEWYHHFREGGYDSIEWVEIEPVDEDSHPLILAELRRIHVPGEFDEHRFVVRGHVPDGEPVDWIQ